MDFYIIELDDRLKIGISKNVLKRINDLKNQAGIHKKEILNLFHFENCGIFEAQLKNLFKPYKARGEWFYKRGLVEIFINEIKKGEILSSILICEIQNKNNKPEYILNKNAKSIYEKIKKERKGVGFPKSVLLETMIKTNKMRYRNMVYHINSDFSNFTREPNFDIENIKNSEAVESLRIIKNNTDDLEEKKRIQSYINNVFNGNLTNSEEILALIRMFFLNTKLVLQENENIRIEYDDEVQYYLLKNDYKDLNSDEYALLKRSVKIEILSNSITFSYKNGTCFCFYEEEDYPRILNLFKNKDIEYNCYENCLNIPL